MLVVVKEKLGSGNNGGKPNVIVFEKAETKFFYQNVEKKDTR